MTKSDKKEDEKSFSEGKNKTEETKLKEKIIRAIKNVFVIPGIILLYP